MSGRHVLTVDRTIITWLTPEVRRAIYALAAAILGILAALGVITADDQAMLLDALEKLGGALVLLIATLHTGGVYLAPVREPSSEEQEL